MSDRLLQYYTTVHEYHRLAEESHQHPVVGPEQLLPYMLVDGLVVDIAGGSGYSAELLGISPGRYVSVDASLSGARMVVQKGRGSTIQGDVANLPLKDGVAENVLCSYSLEHFSDPDRALSEIVRVTKAGGRILIWGPNWDNIFRMPFPQFSHKSPLFIFLVRCRVFLRMIRNTLFPFRYRPFVTLDVAALVHPEKYISEDSDAVHCVLLQETTAWFTAHDCRILHVSDFAETRSTLRNDAVTRAARRVATPLLPVLRVVPLIRWFVLRFPLIVEKRSVPAEVPS